MNERYQIKIKFSKESDDGFLKNEIRKIVIHAVGFTDAEKQAYEYMESETNNEFSILEVKKASINDIIASPDTINDNWNQTWYQAKIRFQTVDQERGKAKMATNLIMINCEDIQIAMSIVDEYSNSFLVPVELIELKKTDIYEIIQPSIIEDELSE